MLNKNIENIARWLWGLLKTFVSILRRRPVRYIRITPGLSFLKFAKIFDLKTLRLLDLRVRSRTESIVIDQILVDRCYDTSNMRRHQDILFKYNELLRNDKVPLIVDCGANIGISAR